MCHWRVYSWAQRLAGKIESLSVDVRIHLNSDLLTIADDIITTENVTLLNLLDNKN
jgi:hypothetical protein